MLIGNFDGAPGSPHWLSKHQVKVTPELIAKHKARHREMRHEQARAKVDVQMRTPATKDAAFKLGAK